MFTFPQLAPERPITLKKLKAKMLGMKIENFLRWSAVCLFSAVYLIFLNKLLRGLLTLKKLKAKMFGMKILNS